MPDWLTDVLVLFGDAWVAWVVVASSVLVYSLMTLTLRAAEPREFSEQLSLAHGQVSSGDSVDEVVNYRSMRIVLTTVRTASVVSLVMGSMNVVVSSGGELILGALLILASSIILGLIVLRALLNRLADACYDDVKMWLEPLECMARRLGMILPFRRFATHVYRNGTGQESSTERADNILTVARNLTADDVRVSDLMVGVSDVVAVRRGMRLDEMRALLVDADLEFVVVYGESIDDVLGVARASDVLRSLLKGAGEDSSSDSVLSSVLQLTPTQHVAAAVDAFRKHEDRVGIVIGEDGKLVGILTYGELMRRLFSNGEAQDKQGEGSTSDEPAGRADGAVGTGMA